MPRNKTPWLAIVILGSASLLGACSQTDYQTAQSPVVQSNPPPIAPGPNATWYHVSFETNSFIIGGNGQRTVAELMAYMQSNPGKVATIIGRTDTVGSREFNMHLSHQRADAVRDALVYNGNIPAERVETRWTGETRQRVQVGDEVAAAGNRVVDIAVH